MEIGTIFFVFVVFKLMCISDLVHDHEAVEYLYVSVSEEEFSGLYFQSC